MKSSRQAFTLVELLLVVAIISLLIAILLPSLANVRDHARELRCTTNMSQVSSAAIAYASNHRGEFPANRYHENPSLSQHSTWRGMLVKTKYASDGDIWICPGPAPQPPQSELGRNIHGSQCVGDVKATNYAYNGAAFWRFSPNGAPDGAHPHQGFGIPNARSELTLRNVRFPSRTFILLESLGSWPDLGDWCISWNPPVIGYWHRKGANWAITDGSMKWARLLDTAVPECWWHNFPEPNNFHIDWESQVHEVYR